MWDTIKSVVGTVAPTVATALGGPLAGMAVSAIGEALGLSNDEDIQKVLQNPTPEQLLAIKEAEQKFIVNMCKLEIDVERIHAEDRNSARKREVSTGDIWTPRILAAATMLSFFACIYFVFSDAVSGVSPEIMGLIGGIIGYASSKADMVISYYFGSSSESDAKSALLLHAPQGR